MDPTKLMRQAFFREDVIMHTILLVKGQFDTGWRQQISFFYTLKFSVNMSKLCMENIVFYDKFHNWISFDLVCCTETKERVFLDKLLPFYVSPDY